MVGYAFYMFEGVGSLLPVMREVENPQDFAFLTVSVQWTLCIIQILFSTLCYYAWAGSIVEPIITEILPAGNVLVQIMKLLYCINLVYSYRVSIVPTFSALEQYILGVKEKSNLDDGFENEAEDQGNDDDY